jgi:hypothetical protein
MAKQVAEWGEPWIFGLPDNEEERFITPLGLQAVVKLAIHGPEAERTYVTRRDGSVIVPGPPPPYHFWILEAVVPPGGNSARAIGTNSSTKK